MAEFRRFVKTWGEWVEREPRNIYDRIAGTHAANARQREIDYLVQELGIDAELARMSSKDD